MTLYIGVLFMAYVPLFLRTSADLPVLVIGGGAIAAAKIEALAGVGTKADLLSDTIGKAARSLCDTHGFKATQAPYQEEFLEGYRIVVAATNDNALNERIAADCRARGIMVNVVDNPPLCDFIFPALIKRGPLQIAISTSGISPVLARLIKHMIEQAVPAQFENLIRFMDEKKSVLRKFFTNIQPRRLFYEQIIRGPIAEEVLEGNARNAEDLFNSALEQFPKNKQPALYLVGAGPGHPELITLKAIRLLSQADVILHDRLISPVLLEQYARKDAHKIPVGKTRDHHLKKQEDIGDLIEKHLLKGDIVVRLKGGDPGVFAHGAEEIEIARRVGAPYQIVPGISAANGCAAYSGIPLTERDGAKGVRFMTLYTKTLHQADFWEGLRYAQNETLVFYMSTPHYVLLCEKLHEIGFRPDTPVMVVEQGTTPEHRDYVSTLSQFDVDYGEHAFISPSLIIVGDVVRWRETNGWKEAPEDVKSYFSKLPEPTEQDKKEQENA